MDMNPDSQKDLLDVARHAARSAGRCILEGLGRLEAEDVEQKQAFDFVTRIDRESEDLIIGIIRERFPHHHILSEESIQESGSEGFRWIIDPLDGTTNFIHQYPAFAVSIGVQSEGEDFVAVVFDPLRDEMFHALKGKGAFLNGRPIRTSPADSAAMALIATGFPFRDKSKLDLYLQAFKRVFIKVSGIRRAGSAALDLAYVAAGRFEGFFEIGLKPWDIAAGALLIKEAGGVITDFGGGGDYLISGNVVAGNGPVLHREVLDEIRAVFSAIIDR